MSLPIKGHGSHLTFQINPKKVQHMFKTLIVHVTFMESLVLGNVVVFKKIRKVLHYRQTNLQQTLFDQKSSL